jgi:drug/metabolite transporter (DMT)-like permease
MNSKVLACIAFLFNTVLFGTYYAISKEVLGRIDPIIFTFFEMMTLVPAAICIIICSRRQITRAVLKRGLLLGSSLCLALFTIAIALKYTTATGTAFFPSLNGLLAAFIAWIVLRHPITKATWFAGLISIVGTVLLIANASMGGPRGSLIAFLGGLFFTGYVFLADHEQKDEHAPWAIFGIELLTMGLWANLIVLLFGDWNSFHPNLPRDAWVILYVAVACTFLTTMITVLMQKYISPVTVSFIYILEPIFGAIVASFYLHETLPLNGYLGGGLVVVGAVIHTWGSAGNNERTVSSVPVRILRPSLLGTLAAPVLIFVAGVLLLYKLRGSPAPLWSDLYHTVQMWPTFVHQGLSAATILIFARALCWLIAWAALLIMVCRASWSAIIVVRRNRVVTSEEEPALDARVLRHMGVTPYSDTRKEARKRGDKPLVQQRRKDRKERLAGIASEQAGTHSVARARLLSSSEMSRRLETEIEFSQVDAGREAVHRVRQFIEPALEIEFVE